MVGKLEQAAGWVGGSGLPAQSLKSRGQAYNEENREKAQEGVIGQLR